MKKTTKKKKKKSKEELMSLMDNFDDGTLASLTESRETINCPHCKKVFPVLVLCSPSGRVIPLERAAVPIGRDSLDGNATVSAQHAIFRRRGPVTYVESRGRNGTYRWNGKSWVRLPDNTLIAVKAGDRLRFGELDVQFREAS